MTEVQAQKLLESTVKAAFMEGAYAVLDAVVNNKQMLTADELLAKSEVLAILKGVNNEHKD